VAAWIDRVSAILKSGVAQFDDAPIDIEKRGVPTTTLGSTGLLDAGGMVQIDERDPRMIGENRWREFDRMVRDISIVAAGVRAYLNLVTNAEWTVNPPEGEEDNPQAQEIAKTAYDILFSMTTSWSTVVRKEAMFRFTGSALQEWTAVKRPDGAIGLLDIENRPVRTIARWNRDKSGTIESVTQQLPSGGQVIIPRSKLIYAVDDTFTEAPEGMGLLRHCVETSKRLDDFLRLEKIGYETDLRGIPIARAPLGELKKEVDSAGPPGSEAHTNASARRNAMLKPVKDFITKHIKSLNTGMLLPSDTYLSTGGDTQTATSVQKWALELLQGQSSSFSDMASAINRLNSELARILGVEHLMLGADGTGSLALSQSKIGTFYLTITSTLLDLLEVFERDLIEPLAVLNGWPEELIPELGVAEIRDQDIAGITAALRDMALAGAVLMPDDPAIGEIRDLLGLSRPPEDGMAMDAALTPTRNDPADPADPDQSMDNNPEDRVAKKWMRSRRSKERGKLAKLRKARNREAA
jgi:hypothetical protein